MKIMPNIKKIKLGDTTYNIKDEAAYVKPSGGIPQADLDQSTRTTLTTINDLLKNDDANTTVDTIREVLDVFAAYPEETTIVNALAGKAAVDHSHVLTPTTATVVTAINSGSGSFTPTTKYLHTTTTSVAPNSHTHNVTVSGTTGANSGTAISAVTSVGTLSGGSGELTSVTTKGTNDITYVESVTHTAASLTGTKTFNTNAIRDIALSASDTSTAGPKYVESISGNAPSLTGTKTFVTAYNSFSGGSGSLISNTTVTGGIPYLTASYADNKLTLTTQYLHHTHTAATLGAASTGTVTISGGSYSATTKYMAHSTTAAGTGTVGISGGSISPTTKYLHHTHTGASLSGTKTSSVAPSGHTHTFSDDATTEATTASAVSAITSLAANATASTGDITYVESATHTHTGASVKSSETVVKTVTID